MKQVNQMASMKYSLLFCAVLCFILLLAVDGDNRRHLSNRTFLFKKHILAEFLLVGILLFAIAHVQNNSI